MLTCMTKMDNVREKMKHWSKNKNWIELSVCVVYWLTDVLAVFNDQILLICYLI